MGDSKGRAAEPAITDRLQALLQEIAVTAQKAPQKQQAVLLRLLEDWKHGQQRKDARRSIAVPVDYAIDDRAYKGLITNVSAGGVFIDSPIDVPVGKEITLTFSLPQRAKPFKTIGKIAWKDGRRFGVEFKVTPYLREHMKKLIESL
jgi:hypothetical protein